MSSSLNVFAEPINSANRIWHPGAVGVRRAAALLTAAFIVLGAAGGARAVAPREAIERAGKFLVERQGADGGWGSTPSSDEVADAVVGLVSARVAAAPIDKALDFIAERGPAEANRPSMVSRIVLGIVAAGKNPRDFGRVDYIGRLRTYYNPSTGAFDANTDPNSLAILAYVAGAEPLPERAVTSLQNRQCSDGGFPRTTCVLGSDVGSTALALNALIAAKVGSSDPAYAAAREFLLGAGNREGGYGNAKGGATAAEPTSRVLSVIAAMGEDPAAAPWHRPPNVDPAAALASLQDGSGGFRTDSAATGPDEMTTARALPGFASLALPVRPASLETPPTSTPTTVRQAASGATTTTVAPSRTTVARPGPARPAPEVSVPTPDATGPGTDLAAPARDDGSGGGRSLMALAPFIATLFGAGAVGIVLRRRARI